MTLEIKRGNAAQQLTSLLSIFQGAAIDINTTKTAIEAFVSSPDLIGRKYDSIRAQYESLHLPVLRGMLCYIDEMLAANNAYGTHMGTLKACYLNEATLISQIAQTKNLKAVATNVPFFDNLIQRLETNIQEKLKSLYDFEAGSRGLYGIALALLNDVNSGIAVIEASVYNPASQTFSLPPGSLDMSWREKLDAAWNEKMANGMKVLEFTDGQVYARGVNTFSSYSMDPVNLSTGNLIYQKEDLRIHGVIPLVMTRFYNALDTNCRTLGKGWVHSYEQRLEIQEDRVIFHRTDGKEETYMKVADGLYIDGHTGMGRITMEPTNCRYHYQEKNGYWYDFDLSGCLLAYGDKNDNQVVLIYEEGIDSVATEGVAVSVVDTTEPANRILVKQVQSNNGSLNFTYTEKGHLSSVTDHTGRQITYHHKDGSLEQAIWPDGQTLAYTYSPDGYMETITNPDGITSVINTFDKAGRTSQQTFADGGTMSYHYNEAAREVTLTEQNNHQITYVCDEQYRTVKIKDAEGEERFAYNKQNQRTLAVDKLGRETRYEYDARGNMTKITDPLGNQFEQTYTPQDKLISLRVNKQLKLQNQYDDKGNRIQGTDSLGRSLHLKYNEQGRVIAATQADNSTIQIAYDAKGNPIAITDAMGHTTRYEYDEFNRVIKVTNPIGNITKYTYNSRHDIVKVVNAEGRERRYTYNKNNKVTSITNFDGSTDRIEYNEMNNPSQYIDVLGHVTRIEYDKMWNVIKETDPNGAETRFTYTPHNRLESITDPMGAVILYEYDAVGNPTKITGPQGQVIKITYDNLNRYTEITELGGAATQYIYNTEGRVTQIVDAMGNKTHYAYNAAGQKTQETNALGHTTRYTYTPLGRIETVTDAKGGVCRREYYPGGKLKRILLPEGENKTYEYDQNGNIARTTDALGRSTEFVYDTLDRVIEVKNPLGYSKHFSYDAVGNITKVTDENGHITQYKYSLLGDIIQVTDALGHSTKFEYDRARRLSKIEQYRLIDDTLAHLMNEDATEESEILLSPETQITTFERNLKGCITAVHRPLGKTARYKRDTCGNVISKTDEDNLETRYEFNIANQLSKISYADGKTVELSYNPLKQLIKIKDWLGISTLTPDPLGRAEKITDFEGKTIEYHWDELSRRTKMVYPATGNDNTINEVHYTYNRSGRLASVISAQGEALYKYDAMGKLIQTQRPDSTTQFEYTPTDFIECLTHARGSAEILDQFRYTYDPAGQIIQINKYRQSMPAGSQGLTQGQSRPYSDNDVFQYAYDPVGRLINAVYNGKQKEYFYDSLGNRIASYESPPDSGQNLLIYHEYNALNQQIRSQGRDILEKYHYDRRGNMTEILANGSLKASYTFDAANKMTQAWTDKGQVHYTYDGFLNRVKRLEQVSNEEPSQETRYILDATLAYDNLLMTEGSQNQSYIWGNHLLAATGATEVTYLQDHLNSPIRLLGKNDQDAVLNYDEFGALLTKDGQTSLSGQSPLEAANPFGFTGYQTEDITGLYYAQARYYNPHTSRWLSEDPIHADLNWYTYCRNNPLRFVDPSGLIPSDMEAAYMASDVYDVSESDYGKVLPGGWKLTQIMKNNEGMKIGVYERTIGGVTEYTLASKGSRTGSDWKNNFEQPFGWSSDMRDSIDKSGSFVQDHRGSEVTMVGHSKGGAEAAANAVNANMNCIVFNPATVFLEPNGLSTDNYGAHMQVFVVKGEILHGFEGLFSRPIGDFEYLPTKHKPNYSLLPFGTVGALNLLKTSGENHGMDAVIWGLKERCGGTCPVGPPPTSPVISAPPEATNTDFDEVVPDFVGP